MKTTNRFLALALIAVIALLACSSPASSEPDTQHVVINIANILGITPVTGEKPVTTIEETAQFLGTVTWEPAVSDTFEPLTAYTATITLTLKSGFTLEGLPANFFTVNGSDTVSFTVASGTSATITAVFPATGGTADNPVPVSIFAIPGIVAPVTGAQPVTTVNTAQYAGSVVWDPAVQGAFAASTDYTATITLSPRTGFTMEGVAANAFTVAGVAATNDADSGVVKAVFPTTGGTAADPTKINIAAILGVTAPAFGESPVSAITPTAQYTGSVTWTPTVSGTFAAATDYTATITLSARIGYTFEGVAADFFTVAGAAATNAAGSGAVTAVFPATAAPSAMPVNIAAIQGVTAPVTGAAPVNTITATEQYTGTVSWSPSVSGTFTAPTEYTATITLTAKGGFTFQGVAADFFTVAGAAATNDAGSGVVKAVFPETVPPPVIINIPAIDGIAVPVVGAAPVTAIDETMQFTGSVTWEPTVSDTFAPATVYTAIITLTAKAGYTFSGVGAYFFTVAGANPVSNAVNSGTVEAVFPQTGNLTITDVDITVIPPVTGEAPVTTASGAVGFSISAVAWTPDENPFLINKQYTATLTLSANTGYLFAVPVTAAINGNAANIISNTASSVTLSYQFPLTILPANKAIGVNFSGGFVDEAIDLTKNNENDLSLTNNDSLTITVAGDFNYYQYYNNGYHWTSGYNPEVTLGYSNFSWEPVRTNSFTVICWKGLPWENGVPYSKEVTYRVVW